MTGYVLPNPFMSLSKGTRSRQPMVTDSRSVAAEWGDGLLDAGGDTKRLSTQDADGHASGSGAPAYSPDDLAWANQAIDEYYSSCGGLEKSHSGPEQSWEPLSAQVPEGVASLPHGYPCCPDCGYREPCDRHCPNSRAQTGFQMDEVFEAALMEKIEPPPLFLQRPDNRADEIEELLKIARAEEWPAAPRRAVG